MLLPRTAQQLKAAEYFCLDKNFLLFEVKFFLKVEFFFFFFLRKYTLLSELSTYLYF
jgi:hypothetical protein